MAQHVHDRKRFGIRIDSVLIYLALVIVFLLAAYPFFYIISLSVMPYSEYLKQTVHAWPSGFTLFYFEQIARSGPLVNAFGVSIAKTVIGTALNVVATMMAGYALSRPELKFRKLIVVFFLIPIFVGSGIIPFYLVIQGLGLINTFWALILPNLVAAFNLFLVKAYFSEYAQEIIEAAVVDGAGPWRTFWQIIWPTSVPIIATMALLYGVSHWNDFVIPSILVQSDLYPATVVLRDMTNTRLVDLVGINVPVATQSFVAAVSTLLVIPILIVYPFIQRYVIKGLMVGAVKG